MTFDSILAQIGEFGGYQRKVYFLATIPAVLLAAETLSVIFIFYIPRHRCAIPGYDSDMFDIQNENQSRLLNETIPQTNGKWDQCHVLNGRLDTRINTSLDTSHTGVMNTSKCQQWVYDLSTFDSTIATEFDIVCDRTWHRAGSNMLSEVGSLIGTITIGFIADRFGRKTPFYLGGLALIGGGLGIAFVTNLIALNICRILLGFSRCAAFANGLIIGMEMVGPSMRTYAGMIIELMWCLGEFYLLFFVYFIRNWRYLEIALSIPSVGLLFYWWLIPESPRWLCSRGRQDEAVAILQRIAASNKTKMPSSIELNEVFEKGDQLNLRLAFESKEFLFRLIFFILYLFVCVVSYYALTLNITNLSGDIFINFLSSIIVEVVSYTICMFLLEKTGRRLVCTASLLLAGAACCLSVLPVLLQWPGWTAVTFSVIGRFGICIAITAIYVYGAELFPTVLRGSAMGVGITCGRVGGLLAPYVADMGMMIQVKYSEMLPMVLMGVPALFMAGVTLWMPETHRTTLPDTILDLHRSSRRCCLSCITDDRETQKEDEDEINEKEKVPMTASTTEDTSSTEATVVHPTARAETVC